MTPRGDPDDALGVRSPSLAFALCALIACTSAPPAVTEDAGVAKDAGAPNDAGATRDAGTKADGGTPFDGGPPTDAGADRDGGPVDAGPPRDGGTPVACPTGALEPGEHEFEMTHDGDDHDWEVQVPAGYDNTTPVPLVLDLHPYLSNKDFQQTNSEFAQLAETEGFVVVRPNGFRNSWNGGVSCCAPSNSDDKDHVGLLRRIVDETKQKVCIDARRVYVTGHSNGAAMSHRLACEAADVFAAAAPVSFPIGLEELDSCTPSRPISVIHFHGDRDTIVPYNGRTIGQLVHPTPESFERWSVVDGCTGQPTESYAMGDTVCETYTQCDAGVEVTLCTLDSGHLDPYTIGDIDTTQHAWDFLSRFTLP